MLKDDITAAQRAVVTGAAGFIGSTLVDALLAAGHEVVGVDAFTGYYDASAKEANLRSASSSSRFQLRTLDLASDPLDDLLAGADVVFHLAGQPGVRASWGRGFEEYVRDNVLATQRLLEAARHVPLRRFVNSSSSSVYGRAERYPTSERDLPAPVSPYGVTKLAAEHLCTLYGSEFGVPTVSLRYFTVYGPRQRPDMATHRIVEAARRDTVFVVNGDGTQTRDFTFVADAVAANLDAAGSDVPAGSVFNVGGGAATSLLEVVRTVERCIGRPVRLETSPRPVGDPDRTGGDTSRARADLGWSPRTGIEEGIAAQVAWHLERSP